MKQAGAKQVGTAVSDDLKERILSNPELILEDRDLMRALISASDRMAGDNIIDLRGIAMERLEAQLERLEESHSNVIAAAYENLVGMNQIHRAILKLLEPVTLRGFLTGLREELPEILQVESLQLLIEQDPYAANPGFGRLGSLLKQVKPGFINEYLTRGRDIPIRQITLRQTLEGGICIFHATNHEIRSEACLALDLGRNRPPAMLAFGSEHVDQFDSAQGTDLLVFFAGAFERSLRRLLP